MRVVNMSTLTKRSGKNVIKESNPVKQDKIQGENRDSLGRFKVGKSGNPNGRPPAGKTIVDMFRDNPTAHSVINKLFAVANTLGEDKPDKDAIAAAKLVIERLIPSLKASELRVDTENDTGFVLLPTPEEPEKE